MNDLLTATCDRSLTSDAPDWVHLFPAGAMTARDGRQFNLADPQAVIADFAARAVELPVDYEHQADSDLKERSGPVPAAGWIKDLKADERGLWGRVEWTAQARDLISQKAYRYLSPSFFYSKVGREITRLKGAGLVHKPALHLQALASEENDMDQETTLLARLVASLKLPEGTTEEDVFAKLDELGRGIEETDAAAQRLQSELADLQVIASQPDPARFVPIEVVKDLMQSRGRDLSERARERAETKVADALRSGHITPAMKDWATALCASDEASFAAFVTNHPPMWGHIVQPSGASAFPPETSRKTTGSDAEQAVCSQLGLKPDALET